MLGRIHSIETLGGLDGPGLRCVVFLQGCAMRCLYCQNPDTWSPAAGQETDSGEVVHTVQRYKPYFGPEGGVTLSGGEPFMQAAFAREILAGCRALGIHTAVDTCGYYLDSDVIEALCSTDLVILDIKHADSSRHKQLTGQELERPLAFLRHVAASGIDLWVRQVIVPGWNDTEDDIRALAELVKDLPSLRKAELLGYHAMARWKWEGLGLKYPLADVPEPSPERLAQLQTLLDGLISGRARPPDSAYRPRK